MHIPPGGAAVHYGEDPRPFKSYVELPENPLMGSRSQNDEEAFSNLQKHYEAFERFWTEQATGEQLEYCARLAAGDTGGDDIALWLPPGYLDSEGGAA